MSENHPTIAVLGAGGLIGHAVAEDLRVRGFRVVAMARRFAAGQEAAFASDSVTTPLVALDTAALRDLLAKSGASVVVNCIGVLQDGPGASTQDVHEGFVARLLAAMSGLPTRALLVQISMPGREDEDRTAFAGTKRAAERAVAASGAPYVVLRPAFVIAPAAYGGSALLRALAMLPVSLPAGVAGRPFAATAVADISRTIALAASEWVETGRDPAAFWEICEREPGTVGDVLAAFRSRLGGPRPFSRLPNWAMSVGALAGDLVARLGWAPPIRSTALAEMRRGVAADSRRWMEETGLVPATLREAMSAVSISVQERWFARLYLAKALIVAALAIFWIVSGVVALTVAFEAARAILVAHGVPRGLATAVTVATSLCDIVIGLAIAHRRTVRAGLLGGILLSLGYMAGAAILAPDLWLDPLGALVKTGPAIVLMLIALLILDDR